MKRLFAATHESGSGTRRPLDPTSRVALDATAYPHRNAKFVMNVHRAVLDKLLVDAAAEAVYY
jgi:hypothetical protein